MIYMGSHMEGEIKDSQDSVSISFGTLFTVICDGIETERVDVIVDIGIGDNFLTYQVEQDNEGIFLVGGGTASSKEFGVKFGKLSSNQVVNAAILGAKKSGKSFTPLDIDYFKKAARKGTRTLELKR